MEVNLNLQSESDSWSRLLARRRKLAEEREKFFHSTIIQQIMDERKTESIAQQVVSSVLLQIVNETLESIKDEEKREELSDSLDKSVVEYEDVEKPRIIAEPQLYKPQRVKTRRVTRMLGRILERFRICAIGKNANQKNKSRPWV